MIEGRVTATREAIVRIEVIGPHSTKRAIEFVVDTDFTGYISLSDDEISTLGLPAAVPSDLQFASGELRKSATYTAHVSWDGVLRRVTVIPLEGGHLLGMRLLSGATITIEATSGGYVAIDCDTLEPFDR